MWQEILNIVISNGIFATLFVLLLLYLLKDSAKREDKYTNTISALNRHLNIVENIENDIADVKVVADEINDNVKNVKHNVENVKRNIEGFKNNLAKVEGNVESVKGNVAIVQDNVKETNNKIDKTNEKVLSIDKDLKNQTKAIKKVSSDVRIVEDVKEMKKIIFQGGKGCMKIESKHIVLGGLIGAVIF